MYQERVGRYRIFKRDARMSAERRAMYVAEGEDPDAQWGLYYSSDNEVDAKRVLARQEADHHKQGYAYKLEDWKSASMIERPIY